MDLREAIRARTPLQVRVPDPKNPLAVVYRAVAEAFLVASPQGEAVAWVYPFWLDLAERESCHISYAQPKAIAGRWVDESPRYGPRCLVCQSPFVMEPLAGRCAIWADYKAWRIWASMRGPECGRRAAWSHLLRVYADLGLTRAPLCALSA